jgi:hypothetical protein
VSKSNSPAADRERRTLGEDDDDGVAPDRFLFLRVRSGVEHEAGGDPDDEGRERGGVYVDGRK